MKILIDTDILREFSPGIRHSFSMKKFLNMMMKYANHSLWISALSVEDDIAPYLLNGHRNTFTIIPLRQSTLIQAANSQTGDFESRVLIASAEEFNVDAIVSKDPSRFTEACIPVLTPQEFVEKQDTGEWDKVKKVPFMDLKAQHPLTYNEIDNQLTDIIANTGFILGRQVEEFEDKFAKKHGADFCLGVSSGTDALHIALAALNVGPGDRVVVPVNTFIATAEAVSMAGATPVFVDCDGYYNMDVEKLEEVLKNQSSVGGGKIRAVIPVHLYGQPADMTVIRSLAKKYGLAIIEDACQAHLAEYKGRKIGTFGHCSAFSFYPGKNLGAYGEAGAFLTNDETLFARAKMIRQHGEVERYHHTLIGHNYRMAAIQGAVLNSKLPYLDKWTEKRRTIAGLYNEGLKGIGDIQIPEERDDTYCVHHLYVIQTEIRDQLQAHLLKKGIGTGLHYPIPLHLQKAYKNLGHGKGDFPTAEKAALRILSLPMFPELSRNQVRYVCDNIRNFPGYKE
jgi:dTDP-4-amino-4,6-dideoxygalactose transaminase